MAENITSKLLLGFVTLLLGVVLIGTISSEGLTKTTFLTVSETQALNTNTSALNTSGMEASSYQIAQSPTSWKVDDCPITNFIIANSSGSVLVEDTDYDIVDTNGTWRLLKTNLTARTLYPGNVSYQTYTYCGDDYMNSGWGRTGINLVSGFFALGLLITAIGFFYSAAKDTGMLG